MGDHSRYDYEGRFIHRRPGKRTRGRVGSHRAGARRAYSTAPPACDATAWDYRPYRASHRGSHRARTRLQPLGFAVLLTAAAAGAIALTTLLGPSTASAGQSHPVVHRARRTLQLSSAQLMQLIKSRAASEAARYSAITLRKPATRTIPARVASDPVPAGSPAQQTPVSPPPSPPAIPAGTGPGPHSLYDQAQIEALWVAEGGSPALAGTAACIAEHESGDGYSNSRPWAFNGRDIGMWQIDPGNYDNGSHSSDLYLPWVNARVAVQLQRSQGWYPWTTRGACGA